MLDKIPFNVNEPFLAFLLGKPRSGKSYLASFLMFYYGKEENDTFIFTDVQGIQETQTVKKIDLADFTSLWTQEYSDIQNRTYADNHDEIYRQKFKEKGYLGSLIVLDECQNILADESKIWLRIFSYYGHYDLKMVFITQDLTLVNKKYKATPDKFIKAHSPDSKLTNNAFKYTWYSFHMCRHGRFFDDSVETFKVPAKKEVFEFYNSGGKVLKKSSLPNMLKVAIIPSLFMLFMGIAFVRWQNNNIETSNENKKNNETYEKTTLKQAIETKEIQPEIIQNNYLDYVPISFYPQMINGKILYFYDDYGNKITTELLKKYSLEFQKVNDFIIALMPKNMYIKDTKNENNQNNNINMPNGFF